MVLNAESSIQCTQKMIKRKEKEVKKKWCREAK